MNTVPHVWPLLEMVPHYNPAKAEAGELMLLPNQRTTSTFDGQPLEAGYDERSTVRIGDLCIDTDTGELVAHYVNKEVKYTAAERAYHSAGNIAPVLMTSGNQLADYMDKYVDKRKLVRRNDARSVHDGVCGIAKRDGTAPHFTVPEFNKLFRLADALMYRNLIIGTVQEVAKLIGVSEAKVQRELQSLIDKGLVQYFTSRSGMTKGHIKIVVNPTIGWVYESGDSAMARGEAIKAWYKPTPASVSELMEQVGSVSGVALEDVTGDSVEAYRRTVFGAGWEGVNPEAKEVFK